MHHIPEDAISRLTDEQYIAFYEALDRFMAQLIRERNIRYGRPCQPLRRPKARRRNRR